MPESSKFRGYQIHPVMKCWIKQASSMANECNLDLEIPIKIYQDKEIIDEAQPF